jgi:hypothetical protein
MPKTAKPKDSQFVVESWTIEQIEPTLAEYNPRIISERDLTVIGKGMEEFGFLLPVVINKRTNRMVSGHQRFKAAKAQDLTAIPVHLVDLGEGKEKTLNLALNKIEGRWDYALLEEALSDVAESSLLALSGFNESDLVEIMAGQDEEFQETFEQFTQRFSGSRTQNHVSFRSAQVVFNCTKSVYEALVQRLYAQVGVDDIVATLAFFRLIGLED